MSSSFIVSSDNILDLPTDIVVELARGGSALVIALLPHFHGAGPKSR